MVRIRWITVLMIGLTAAALAGGCEGKRPAADDPIGVRQDMTLRDDQADWEQPLQSSAVEGSAPRTTAQISRLLHAGMTQQEATQQLGPAYDAYTLSDYLNGQWIEVDIWRYDYANKDYRFVFREGEGLITPDLTAFQNDVLQAQLFLEWSKDGKLIYAVLYYEDADGNVHNYIPAFGNLPGTSSEDSQLAAKNGIKIGQTVGVKRNGAAFDLKSAPTPQFAFLTSVSESYQIKSLMAHFAELDLEGSRGWVPLWYLTEKAMEIREIKPQRMIMTGSGTAEWYPNAGLSAAELVQGESVYIFEEYGDYYGAVAPLSKKADQSPGLVWIKKSLLRSDEEADSGYTPLLSADTKLDSDLLEIAVNSLLRLGESKKRIREVFGEPHFIETSNNVIPTGEPMKTLEQWRYEHAETLLVMTWDEDGGLRGYLFEAEDAEHRSIASRRLDWQWRVQSDMAYNFLIGQAENLLLIAGHDGGFSGMHYDSNLYAVNRHSGAKVWQVDLDFSLIGYVMSEDEKYIAFMSYDSNPEYEGKTIYRVHVIDTQTGEKRWEKELQYATDKDQVWGIGIAAAGQTLAVGVALGDDSGGRRGKIQAWEMDSGEPMWERSFDQAVYLHAGYFAESRLLAQIGPYGLDGGISAGVIGLDPISGKTAWTNRKRELRTSHGLGGDGRNFKPGAGEVWTFSEDAWVLTEIATGKEKLSLPYEEGYYIYSHINDRYILQVKSRDGKPLHLSGDTATSLIEAKSGDAIWTVNGSGWRGKVDGGYIYYSIDEHVRMAQLATGKVIWETDVNSSAFVPYRDYLLVNNHAGDVVALNKSDGSIAWRLSDARVGWLDSYYPYFEYGMITGLDGTIYLGSSNGYFTKVANFDAE
ncbi:hypothetical protein EBB07_30795 [Paenibacillaceae bacterium]|nr:hypothetical protein EBB07_30795 [Paenibacillaceae bacterium]